MRTILMLPLVLAMSACSLTPSLVMPPSPVPADFPASADTGTAAAGPDLGWRAVFTEARLQRAIELALTNNRDLRQAALNVEAAYAQFGIERVARLPTIDASAGSIRQRTADANAATPGVTRQHAAGVNLNAWEIDVFGRVRALSEAAFARYLASEEGFRAVRLALIAAVADAYLAEKFSIAQLVLAEHTLADWRQSLALARARHAAGHSSGLDVAQAQSQVATAETDVEARQRELARARHALVLLAGTEVPEDVAPAPIDSDPLLLYFPVGSPADLLERRPDILRAERMLAAANGDIGAARAAFFPRIALTANLGQASAAMETLFAGTQRVWSFVPQVTLPLFNHGRLRAELRVAELRKSSEVAEYEKAIQTAFREVADGLGSQQTYRRQRRAQQAVVASAERRLTLSEMRYRAGVESRLELLDAQRQLYAARQALLDLRHAEYGNAVALYKAIGGGTA